MGIDYDVQRLIDMLNALARTSYGNPKFFEILDREGQVPRVVFSMGARTSATWEGIAELGLMQDFTVVITGFDAESYNDVNVEAIEGQLVNLTLEPFQRCNNLTL